MAHRRNASDEGDRPDDTYNSIKDQIERETLGLGFVNQREITNPFENRPYTAQVPVSENFSHVLAPRSRIFATEHEQKQTQAQKSNKRALKSKLKDIIDMSKEENRETGKGYKEIIFAERQILGLLQGAQIGVQNRNADQYYAPKRSEVTGIALPKSPQSLPWSHVFQAAPQSTFSEVVRKQPSHYQNYEGLQTRKIQSYSPKASEKQLGPSKVAVLSPKAGSSEEVTQLIAQMENKAMRQILRLREEISTLHTVLNAQRRRNQELEHQRYFPRNSAGAQKSQVEQELRERIFSLENELRNETLRKQGQNRHFPDLLALYEQGEVIRLETLRLLKLKEEKGSDSMYVASPSHLVQQISLLRERLTQVEAENNRLKGGHRGEGQRAKSTVYRGRDFEEANEQIRRIIRAN